MRNDNLFDNGQIDVHEYFQCPVLCKINRKSEPIETAVQLDEFTDMVSKNFDYVFDGISKFYPYELPEEVLNLNVNSIVICGASGSGKSTLLKEFLNSENSYHLNDVKYDCKKAIVSNFDSPDLAAEKLSAVGLNSMPVWCRPRNVLSVGEGFRADVALNLNSYVIFDEFTSTIDRTVAMSTCNGLHKYIKKHDLKNLIFCSCHKDYIPYLQPDIVIDLDMECVYDCRGVDLKKAWLSKCTAQTTKHFGEYLGSIII